MTLRDDPVPPSRRTSNPIPPALERVVLACLAKKPADRPPGAGELNRQLAAIDLPQWSEEQAREWWAAHPETQEPPRDETTDSMPDTDVATALRSVEA